MSEVSVTIWGARGSRPVPGKETLVYGGNTACVEVRFNGRLVILDAGSGICGLSKALMASGDRIDTDVLITHTHWDHIIGIPFFMPIYKRQNRFRIYGSKSGNVSFEDQIRSVMSDPHFPVRFDQLSSNYQLIQLEPGDEIFLDADEKVIDVRTFPNIHPNGGISYRLDFEGKSISYVTDIEIEDATNADADRLVKFIEGSDLLIHDADYTDDEYWGIADGNPKKGWGHSTWQTAVKIANRAKVGQLCLFHHHADRPDSGMAEIEAQAKLIRADTFVAKEGMVIRL